MSNITNVFSKVFSGLNKLFNLDFDDAIVSLLELEDKILTFFVETLPKLPEYFGAMLDSIVTMVDNLLENIDPDVVANIVVKIFNAVIKALPRLMKNLAKIMTTLMSGLLKALMDWLQGDGLKVLVETILDITVQLFQYIIDNLPVIIKIVFEMINQLTIAIISKLPEIFWAIIKALPNLVWEMCKSIVGGIMDFFSNVGNWIKTGWNKFTSWLGFATGTNNAPSGLTLVGEEGPELVDLHGGERIYNAQNTKSILGNTGTSGGNNFNVTFNNVQDTTAYTMMRQLKNYNRQMAINGII